MKHTVVVSAIIMLAELALMRFLPSQIRLTSYFSNLVLLASFFGLGVGLLLSPRRWNLQVAFPLLLATLIGVILCYRFAVSPTSSEIAFYGKSAESTLPPELVLSLLFLATAVVMTPLGQLLGKSMATVKRPIHAYLANLGGSIAGILLFSGLSVIWAPAAVWFAILAVLWIFVISWKPIWLAVLQLVVFTAIPVVLGVALDQPHNIWSPYYHLTIKQVDPTAAYLYGNLIPYQVIASRYQQMELYTAPFNLRATSNDQDVLVIGAGTGPDVAMILANNPNVRSVDAVDIDPAIIYIGKTLNPDRPYDDPCVHVIVTDGRNYLQRTDKKYDLIIYALPDSFILTGFSSNIRLESFLFTVQSFAAARAHLKPNGVFMLYNFYVERWIVDKIAQMLTTAFGTPPYVKHYHYPGNAAAFITGEHLDPTQVFTPKYQSANILVQSTDDWPFLYLKNHTIPQFYLNMLAIILVCSVAATALALGKKAMKKFDWFFFFLGAAFMLLETKSLVTFALLFGTTWAVNAEVFVGILALEFAGALAIARKAIRIPTNYLFTFLLLSLAAQYLMAPSVFLALPTTIRFIGASLFYFCPLAIAGIIFSNRYRDTKMQYIALASNFLGAMIGGVVEYSALLWGYRALTLLILGFYGIAWLLQARHRQA